MHLSGTARRVVAVAIALQAGLATTVLGAGGADATASCEGVTGHLVDQGTTVTAVFHVPTTCDEVSVLSWIAPDAVGGDPQQLVDRKNAHDVPPGDYRWTIAAPPAECFRQLDLRVPGRNVDSIVGGERRCSPSSPTTTLPTPTTTTPTPAPDKPCTYWNVTAKSHQVIGGRYIQHFTLDATCFVKVVSFTATGPNWPHNGPQVRYDRWRGTRGPGAHTVSVALPPCYFQADLVVNHRVIDTATGGTRRCAATTPPVTSPPATPPPTSTTTSTTTPSIAPTTTPSIAPTAVAPLSLAAPITPSTTSTSSPVAVLGLVAPPVGAAAPLPNTGGQHADLASVALIGMAIGLGLLTAGWHRKRSLQAIDASGRSSSESGDAR